MKTEISVACREENLRESIEECILILQACNQITLDLKVKFNSSQDAGRQILSYRYITVHKDSRVDDVLEIYELNKQLRPDNYFTDSFKP